MRGFFWLAILFFGAAFGEEIPQSLWRDAETFFEAGRYTGAIDIYEEMLKRDLNARDERTVLINQGITYLAMDEPEMATSVLQKIVLSDESSPYLVEHLKSHLAEAFLRQAKKRLEGFDISDENAGEVIRAALEDVSDAQQFLDEASEAVKQQLFMQGGSEGALSPVLKDQRVRAKLLMTEILEWREQVLARQESTGERLLQLVVQIDQIVSDMESTAFADVEKPILTQHLSLWAWRLNKEADVWKRLRKDLEDREESLDLLIKAQNEFYTASDLLEEERLWDARASLAKAKTELQWLYAKQEGEDPLGILLAQRYLISRKASLAKNGSLASSFLEEYRWLVTHILTHLEAAHQRAERENRLEEAHGLHFLFERMTEEVSDEREAHFDLLFYNHLSRGIGQLMGSAYLTFKERLLEEGFLSLRVIDARLGNDLLGERVAAARKFIKEARALESLRMQNNDKALQAANLVEKALMAWEPVELLKAKLEELLKDAGRLIEKKDFSEKSVDFLHTAGVEIAGAIIEILRLGQLADKGKQIQKVFNHVVADFEQARGELKEGRPLASQLFLEDGVLWIRRTLDLLLEIPLETPSQVLEKAIDEQEAAIHLTTRAQSFVRDELEGSIKNLLVLSQIEALAIMSQFNEVAKNSVENWEQAAQQGPWPEVLDFVDAGNQAAKRAENALYETTVNMGNVIADQRSAQEFWEKALEALASQENDGEESDSEPGESDAGSSPKEEEDSAGQGEEAAATLQLLQQMERDDEELEERKMIPLKRGLRPW